MGQHLSVEYLSKDDLQRRAEQFLAKHNPSGKIPVPIEDIVDLQLQLDIVPIPGVKRSFDIDAWIARDMTAIYVDQSVYDERPTRYRFSLAHEIAHAVLHTKIFATLEFHDTVSWKRVQDEIEEKDYGWIEWQAYYFAGCVLVPRQPLLHHWKEAQSRASEAGISINEASDAGLQAVAKWIAREFDVSPAVIEHRLRDEKLIG